MDQYVDNRQKEILWDILANPADNGALYAQSLEQMVQQNPQSGILQVLLARTGDKHLQGKASVYYNPRALHKLLNHPEDLSAIDGAGINYSADSGIEHLNNDGPGMAADTVIIDETPVADNEQLITAENTKDSEVEAVHAAATEIGNYNPSAAIEQEDVNAAVFETPVADAHEQNIAEEAYNYGSRFSENEMPESNAPEFGHPQQGIEDDVYDEIVSIEDIGFEAIASEDGKAPATPFAEARFSDPTVETSPEEEEASAVLFHQQEAVAEPAHNSERTINEQEDRLILGGIVNTDYLLFDKKLDELRNTAPAENPTTANPETEVVPEAETQEVSRYDDDKMPYTFMWWLNKTRKEHAENLRPYATDSLAENKKGEIGKRQKTGTADELQQQYYENIFSLTSVSGIEHDTDTERIAFDPNKKEDVIIERFIHTEPQIKPLSADKLDNENKAKKSSEDQNDFVTETLARIYIDQMLYHKAIATYKKLILKFPEKKLYFAAQIEQLEKKTN